jgi:pantothenate synthetase
MIIFHDGYQFEYSQPKRIGMLNEGRYYCLVTAPLHGLVMGSIVYFGKKEPKTSTVLRKVKAEANFHISVGNVKK